MSQYRITTHTLPPDVRERFEIVGSIAGGPRLALPHYGIALVDFSRLTVQDAEQLMAAKFPYLRRRIAPVQSAKPGKPKKKVG